MKKNRKRTTDEPIEESLVPQIEEEEKRLVALVDRERADAAALVQKEEEDAAARVANLTSQLPEIVARERDSRLAVMDEELRHIEEQNTTILDTLKRESQGRKAAAVEILVSRVLGGERR